MSSRWMIVAFLLALVLGACSTADGSPAVAQAARDDINDRFKDPQADPLRWVDRFEAESREVFSERQAIVTAIGLRAGQRVADIGAGTGLFIPLFAAAVGPEGKVFAVDIAPSLVAHMEQRFKDDQRVEVIQSEERSTLLPAASVDVVFSSDTYHHFTYYEDMLESIHRALRAGGTMIVLDFEREPGVSSDWLLEHVRAGKAQVIAEVEAAGFDFVEEIELKGLVENYMLRFKRR